MSNIKVPFNNTKVLLKSLDDETLHQLNLLYENKIKSSAQAIIRDIDSKPADKERTDHILELHENIETYNNYVDAIQYEFSKRPKK